MYLFILLITFIPRNLVSFLCGWLARLRLPLPMRRAANQGFVTAFGIDMSESLVSLDELETIEDVFTRQLKPGARPISGTVCSPADGYLARSGAVSNQTAIQAKGLTYNVHELVSGFIDSATTNSYAWFQTTYLAPHNYHRVHAPVAGDLVRMRYIPGDLWPVNSPGVLYVPRLFSRNERLVFEIQTSAFGLVHVVMVGALNVGRIVSPFWEELTTNANGMLRGIPTLRHLDRAEPVAQGQELGTFMLGSTVVVVFEKLGTELAEIHSERPVRMGESVAQETK